jgi:hypothetical protein
MQADAAAPAERRALRSPLDSARLWARKECLTKAGATDPADWAATVAGTTVDDPVPCCVATATAGSFAELAVDEHVVVALALAAPVYLRA